MKEQFQMFLEPGHHQSDLCLMAAEKFIEMDRANFETTARFAAIPPDLSELEMSNFQAVNQRIASANIILPGVREIIILLAETEEPAQSVKTFNGFLEHSHVTQEIFRYSLRETKIAVASAALEYFARLYRSEEIQEEKLRLYSYAAYFGVAHDLLLGCRSNGHLFLTMADDLPLKVFKQTCALVVHDDYQEMEKSFASVLFEGDRRLTRITEASNGQYFCIIEPGE